MIYIEKNEQLIDKLKDTLSLTSSSIFRIDTYSREYSLIVDVYIKLLYAKERNEMMLRFNGIETYQFFYTSKHSFYNVEILKFFPTKDNKFYISFDPVDENEEIDINDNDVIKGETVEGYFL